MIPLFCRSSAFPGQSQLYIALFGAVPCSVRKPATTVGYPVNLNSDEVADELWAKFGVDEGNTAAQGNILGNSCLLNDNRPGEAEPVKPYQARS